MLLVELLMASECIIEIPKVIHLVYHDWSPTPTPGALPQSYLPEWRGSFNVFMGDSWKIETWDAPRSRDFIEEAYPDFLLTYDSYPLPIQRVDAVRYFILHAHGGVYADLDYEVLGDLSVLLCSAKVALSLRGESEALGVQNSLMASTPGHPFWETVIRELKFRAQMPLPGQGARGDYIMLTTGPTFLSDILREFRRRDGIILLASADVFPYNWDTYNLISQQMLAVGVAEDSESRELPSCQAAARFAASAARERGALAIHHFIGAWTAGGPRCSFV